LKDIEADKSQSGIPLVGVGQEPTGVAGSADAEIWITANSWPPVGEVARVQHFRKMGAGDAGSDSYAGIPIFAHRGLHDFAADRMAE
jgi:hypothetical protein